MSRIKVVDRRRVTASGARRPPPKPGDLPSVPHLSILTPLFKASRYFKEHIDRDATAGRLQPGFFWVTVRGLLISAEQTYAAICALVADRRPKTLPLQAGILLRALLEAFGNLLALSEDPHERSRLFGYDGYRSAFEEYERLKAGYGNVPKWTSWLQSYQQMLKIQAQLLGLTPEQANDPKNGGGPHRLDHFRGPDLCVLRAAPSA